MKIMIDMQIIECFQCHMLFGVSAERQRELINSKEDFYCPSGHRQHYLGETKEQKLQRELNNQKQQNAMLAQEAIDERERRLATERSLRSTKAAKTILKKRIGGGKCPCCSEHFPNLEAHMKKQHPDGKVVPMTRKAS